MFVCYEKKEKGVFHDFNWVENLVLLFYILYVKKFKVTQVVYHKKMFPYDKNSFLK